MLTANAYVAPAPGQSGVVVAQPQRLFSDEFLRLGNWLLCWVLVPNIAFMMLWPIGSPPRYPDILAFGAAGLAVRAWPVWARYLVFVVMLIGTGAVYVARLFQVSPEYMIRSSRFFPELNSFASTEYMIAASGVLAVLTLGALLLRRDGNFQRMPSFLIAVASLLALASADYAVGSVVGNGFAHGAPAGAGFESAVTRSGFGAGAGSRHHLVLVVVESMGAPRGVELSRRLFERFDAPDIQARYRVTRGTTAYFGSTTSGEIRELCGHWGDYPELMRGKNGDCLPGRLAREGYRSTAIHGFSPLMFERQAWWPHAGFDRTMFRPDLLKRGVPACDSGVFAGTCDRAIPAAIAGMLGSADKLQFVYWLTLNSHLPVPESAVLDTRDCARTDPVLAREAPMTCRLFMVWNDTFKALANDVLLGDADNVDMLIVGDHMPPFIDRKQRALFQNDRVPWVLLRARDRATAPAGSKSAA